MSNDQWQKEKRYKQYKATMRSWAKSVVDKSSNKIARFIFNTRKAHKRRSRRENAIQTILFKLDPGSIKCHNTCSRYFNIYPESALLKFPTLETWKQSVKKKDKNSK